jgi:transposase
MSKIKIQVKADLSLIKSQLRKDDKFSQGVRLHAVYQIAKGKDAKEPQEVYSTTRKSVCNRVHRYSAEGLEGLKDRPRPGRPSLLSQSQKLELEQMLQNAPGRYDYNTSAWTGASVMDLINKRFVWFTKLHGFTTFYILPGLVFKRAKAIFRKLKIERKRLRN